MKEIIFKYVYSDGKSSFSKEYNIEKIENGYPYDEISDSPLLRDYRLIHRLQYTGRNDNKGVKVFDKSKVKWRCKDSIIEGVVFWSSYGWYVKDMRGGNTTRLGKCSSLEVIGSIHDKEKS